MTVSHDRLLGAERRAAVDEALAAVAADGVPVHEDDLELFEELAAGELDSHTLREIILSRCLA